MISAKDCLGVKHLDWRAIEEGEMKLREQLEIVIDTVDKERVDDLDTSRVIIWYLVVVCIFAVIGVMGWRIFG